MEKSFDTGYVIPENFKNQDVSKADLARKLAISLARVSHVIGLLKLAPVVLGPHLPAPIQAHRPL